MGRRKKKRRNRLAENWKIVAVLLVILMAVLAAWKVMNQVSVVYNKNVRLKESELNADRPELDVDLLTVNSYSRPGTELKQVNGIVIHYTANPGSGAKDNRNYFENLKDTHATMASSHFVVGLNGEIVQCIPTWEVSYASNDRNSDTVSIECCHPDESGAFTKETYQSMVHLTAWLCKKFGLSSEEVIRHYDVTGKNCPKYFVENEEEWVQFKAYVQAAIEDE